MAGRFTYGDIKRAEGDSRSMPQLLRKWNSRVAKHLGGKVENTADGPRVVVGIGGSDKAMLRPPDRKRRWVWAEVMRPGKQFSKGTRIAVFHVSGMDKMRPGQFASIAKKALQRGLPSYQKEAEHPGVLSILDEVCERSGMLDEGVPGAIESLPAWQKKLVSRIRSLLGGEPIAVLPGHRPADNDRVTFRRRGGLILNKHQLVELAKLDIETIQSAPAGFQVGFSR